MAPPVVQNENPQAGNLFFDVAQNLYLEVTDPDGNLDAATVKITLTGVVVWESDAQQNGYTVAKATVTNGFSYTIDPPSDLEARVHTIEVYAQDAVAETLDTSWTFTAGDYQIGTEQEGAKNPRDEAGFSDHEQTEGGDITRMLLPLVGTGRWLPGVGGPIDMPGPPAAPSSTISFSGWPRRGPDSAAGFADEDGYGFHIGMAGPTDFFLSILPDKPSSLPRGGGVFVGGPLFARMESFVEVPDGAWAEHAAVQDTYTFNEVGGASVHNYPHSRGFFPFHYDAPNSQPTTEAAISDSLFYSLEYPHDYMVGVDDGDGNELLGGYEIEQIRGFGGVDLDDWEANADSAGFYGYGKDGVMRYDGQTTLPGSFASGAGAFNRRGWADNQGLMAFGSIDGDAAAIAADTIQLSGVYDAWSDDFVESASRWYLTGDFDITIDYANFSSSGGSDGGFALHVIADEGNMAYVRRNGPLGRYDRGVMTGGSWQDLSNSGATSDTSGTLRITRTGTSVRTFYWTGVWTEIGGTWDMLRADPVWVRVNLSGTGVATMSVDASNFQIVSGAWTNKASWAEEVFGTHRGNADAFPTNALAVGTWGSFDLIDGDTDLLWMRFDVGTGDILHNDLYRARDSVFKDGILVVAGTAEANNDGSPTIIDFNLDAARAPRHLESAVTGGYFNAPSGQSSYEGRARVIANRNGGVNYSDDYARWSLGSGDSFNLINGVALLIDSGKVYVAGGGNNGLSVFRYTRWDVMDTWRDNVDAASWLTTGSEVYWCWFRPQDNQLFWTADDSGDTVLYGKELAGIESAMHGGSFVATTDKTLPGTRPAADVLLSHHRPVIDGASVYVGAIDEVYRVLWPGGSWVRWLGKQGSGATHEVLPEEMTRLTSITHAQDGSLDLMAVSVELGVRSQVLLYRFDTGVLYAKTELDSSLVNISLAAVA